MYGHKEITRKIIGFHRNEKIEVKADNYFEAFYELGKKVAIEVRNGYRELTAGMEAERLAEEIREGREKLHYMERLSDEGIFKVDGVNYMQRYLSSFYGTSQGVGLTYPEAMMLQMEEIGCQTVMVQDKKTGVVRMIHAEEDSTYNRFEKQEYTYKVVSIQAGSTDIKFYYYPQLFGWGPAIGINETTGLVLCVDDLNPWEECSKGNFTVMAVAFMMLDAGRIEIAEQLVDKLRAITGLKLAGGYAIHMAQTDQDKPMMRSVECIYDRFEYIEPEVTGDRRVIAQSNCPINEDLRPMSRAWIPNMGEWKFDDTRLYIEMRERRSRLLRQAKEIKWLKKSAQQSVNEGLKLLASPEADVNEYADGKGEVYRYFTGLASEWVVAHFSCYIGKEKLAYQLGKFLPKPIKSREYSIRYKDNYAFKEKDLIPLVREAVEEYQKTSRV